jgi:hypothetical protein
MNGQEVHLNNIIAAAVANYPSDTSRVNETEFSVTGGANKSVLGMAIFRKILIHMCGLAGQQATEVYMLTVLALG